MIARNITLRAASNNGPIFSPFSPTTTVFTNLNGTCPTPPGTASILGTVWNDVCSIGPTEPIPANLPPGCVDNGSGGAWADAIQQPGETGIPNVTVMYGAGDCPSCGLGSVSTAENGTYSIPGLTAGQYCVCVNAANEPNIHEPGMWTLVMSGHEGWTYRNFTIINGQTLSGQDFGWFEYPVTTATPPYSKFAFFCTTNPDLSMADFTFASPITDTFELRFEDKVYPCITDPTYSNLMHCYGDRVRENQPVELNLWDTTIQQDIASFETQTPICDIDPVVSVLGECGRHKTEQECLVHSDICFWFYSNFSVGHCHHIFRP